MQRGITLERYVINEIANMGLMLMPDQYGIWYRREKEIEFEGKTYYIGAYVKRDEITRAIEIYGQECLLRQ
jgi:hypothetical protein